jgi:hypothetical protein
LRHGDPDKSSLLFLGNGSRELVRSAHDNTLVVRWVVREYGITLAGPAPETLIEPVPADALKQEVQATMREWAGVIYTGQYAITNRWAWPFVVLTYCRMLHTLATGDIGSKPAGAAWAQRTLDRRWSGLIARAWAARPHPSLKLRQQANSADVAQTLAFIRYALDLSH